MTSNPVTLQISLAPSDIRHARLMLEHQVRVWRAQVSEILLCVDYHRSAGRFSEGWNEGKELIGKLAHSVTGARVVEVDYGPSAMEPVSSEFFGGRPIPAKDFRGGPFYSYFFGMAQAAQPIVLHSDSDIFFGGGSQTWMAEAIEQMKVHEEILFAAPLPGPPTADGRLRSQTAESEANDPNAFRFDSMSTRIFLVDRRRFRTRIGSLVPKRPSAFRNSLKAIVEGNPPFDLPEHLFTEAMRSNGLVRREFLGKDPGMWSLHPPYRCEDFYEKLPQLIRRVEAGDIPDAQRGDYDINSSLVNWSQAIDQMAKNRWWKRLIGRK
jgi:hypothetical protein